MSEPPPDLPPPPDRLRLWHPFDYLRLLEWVYFRPSLLRSYVTANSRPALYLQALILVLAFNVLFQVPAGLAAGRPAMLALAGNALGVSLCTALSLLWLVPRQGPSAGPDYTLSIALGVAWGIVWGIAWGTLGGVAGGLSGETSGEAIEDIARAASRGFAVGVALSVTSCVAEGVAWGTAKSVAISLLLCLVWGVAGAFGFDDTADMHMGIASGFAALLGALRLPIWCLEAIHAVWGPAASPQAIPALWDELMVLPQPRLATRLESLLRADPQRFGAALVAVARNPFQRWAAQRALSVLARDTSAPVSRLAPLIVEPSLRPLVADCRSRGRLKLPQPANLVLLAELAGLPPGGVPLDGLSPWAYRLTRWLRDNRPGPVQDAAWALYQVFVALKPASDFPERLGRLRELPAEGLLHWAMHRLADLQAAGTLRSLAETRAYTSPPAGPAADLLAPFLACLQAFDAVAAEVAIHLSATSPRSRADALLRANARLSELEQQIEADAPPLTRAALAGVCSQWRSLVAEASGQLGVEAAQQRHVDPYAGGGTPVSPPLFVGREATYSALVDYLRSPEHPPVLVYGHRRMGKSSLLRNLPDYLATDDVYVLIDCKVLPLMQSLAGLLETLARRIGDAAGASAPSPPSIDALGPEPIGRFQTYLGEVTRALGDRRLVVAFDEFEAIEDAIAKGLLPPDFLGFLRSWSQETAHFTLIFGGLHTLQELTHDYWFPFFVSIRQVHVTFLSPEAARRLVTAPSPDFDVDYEASAVERILELTGRQPYLLNLLCSALIARLNRLVFDEGQDRPSIITETDVDAILGEGLLQDAAYYFQGVWGQATPSDQAVLRAMADQPGPLTRADLASPSGLALADLRSALEHLKAFDVLREDPPDNYRWCVELMRLWVRDHIGP